MESLHILCGAQAFLVLFGYASDGLFRQPAGSIRPCSVRKDGRSKLRPRAHGAPPPFQYSTEKATLEAYIKKHNLEDKVTLHGFQNSEYINNIMHKSSIYVMTSYTESFGIVLLEAMSNGLPCLAFDSAEGAKEIITSGRDGYLIRHRNHKMMVNKINDLIKDSDKRKELGSAGRRKIKNYSKDKVLEQWLKIINK